MKSLFILAFFCSTLVSTQTYSSDKNAPITEHEIAGSEFYIPDNQMPELKRKALDGDINATGKLHAYFELYKYDEKQDRFWLQIGAENGSPEAQSEFAKFLLNDLVSRDNETLKQDHQRACFWFRKAIANGFPIKQIYDGYLKKCNIGDKN
jgi:TPR repeat protein